MLTEAVIAIHKPLHLTCVNKEMISDPIEWIDHKYTVWPFHRLSSPVNPYLFMRL